MNLTLKDIQAELSRRGLLLIERNSATMNRLSCQKNVGKDAQMPRAGTLETARQAEASQKEDKVELFRFFVPMKPVRGYFPEERQTIERFLSLFSPEDFPVHSTKKFDGFNSEIHKSGDKVVIFSEDGEDNTGRLPGIVAAVRALPWRDLILLAEIEMWRGGKHLPREAVAGYIHGMDEPDDSELVANVYDAVFASGGPKAEGIGANAGDIHKLPFAGREKYLEALGIDQATFEVPDASKKLNRVRSMISGNIEELRAHTEELAKKPGSEGSVAKKAAGAYSLNFRHDAQVKFHNSAALAGVVLERIETKVAGTYNYRYGVLPGEYEPREDGAVELGGKTYIEVGKTFSTARKAEPGTVIEVEFETLNLLRYPDGTVSVTAWAPRVMGVIGDRKEPDTVDAAVEAAKAGRVFQEKEIDDAGETVYKANYVGNKRRLAKYIVDKFPEDVKTVFDPMCGVSGVLIEAARRGCRVKGNDLSIIPYWYSKGIFEGAELSDDDVEKILNASPHDGWLTKEWKGTYPRPRHIRRFIDGLAEQAREWKGPKGWAAKAVLSRTLQTIYADSGSGYSTLRYESIDDVRRVLRQGVKEINGLVKDVSGRGAITNEDAKSLRFPSADVIYFDPPFFRKDKGYVHYFQTYRVMNSILLQEEWKQANLDPGDIPPILERLCKSCRHIFISTSSNEVVPYVKELARHKRTMKRFRVSYRQASGFGSRDVHQREHLYAAKAAVRSEKSEVNSERQKDKDVNTSRSSLLTSHSDPYMWLPDEDETLRYVVQEHWRGKSVHADFRLELEPGGELAGWTLNTLIAGVIEEPVTTLEQAKALKYADYSKIDWDTGEFKKRKKAGAEALVDVEVVCLAGSTEVVTRKGLRLISTIAVGDEVLSHDGSFHKVTRTFKTPAPREMLQLRIMGLPDFGVTANHPILTVRAAVAGSHAELSRSERTRHWRAITTGTPTWIPAGELCPGDYVLFPKPVLRPNLTSLRLETFNGYIKTIAVDEDFLRFVGFYIGDGSATDGKVRLNFNGKTEWDLANEYLRILRKWGIEASLLQRDDSHIDIEFTDKPLSKWLVQQCGSGSLQKQIPYRLLGVKGSMWSALKQGLTDSDGYIDCEGRWRYCTTSKALTATMLLQSACTGEVLHYRKRPNPGLGKNAVYDIVFSKNQPRIVDDGAYLRRPVESVKTFRTRGRRKRIDHVFNLEVENAHSYCLPGASVHNCERKAVEPAAWLTVEGAVKPGEVGATANFPGVFHIVDKGVCEYGAQKPWFHEYFPKSDRKDGGFRYRIFFRQLRVADIQDAEKSLSPELIKDYIAHDPGVEREDWDLGYWEFLKAKGDLPAEASAQAGVVLPAAETAFREEAAWLLIKPIDQTPYVLSDRAVEEAWVPPHGFSALPKSVRSEVPPEYRYWQMENESERREMRDALVSAVKSAKSEVSSEKAFSLPTPHSALPTAFAKRRLVPFNQWGGSAKYAKRLSKKFPEHRRYVEPFCGSAAVFFAKDPVEETVLADIDPDVVFAMKYIRKLTPQKFQALKKYPWTVTRAGYERAKECRPRSDAERFWKFVYGRLSSWGGKPDMGGFSTLHGGQTYDLDELWRFHEALKHARIVKQDWKETLKRCDGAGTLFFIDPPYVGEWGDDSGIPPEEVAEHVAQLKGDYVIAYTDSARARRALSKAGRPFKMKFLEARPKGLWQKRNRLFVASFGIEKSDDLTWVDAAPVTRETSVQGNKETSEKANERRCRSSSLSPCQPVSLFTEGLEDDLPIGPVEEDVVPVENAGPAEQTGDALIGGEKARDGDFVAADSHGDFTDPGADAAASYAGDFDHGRVGKVHAASIRRASGGAWRRRRPCPRRSARKGSRQ